MKKAVYTLIVDDYPVEVTNYTVPLMKKWAYKINADFFIIDERKFPDFPPVYEKLQIYEFGKDYDWNIYIDADALINPDLFDITAFIEKDTILFTGKDLAANRFRPDKYFLRDGRFIGACNWFTVASNWCLDLWKPLDDLTLDEAISNIFPICEELDCGYIDAGHLIDDYVLSRNIAKYGLKHTTMIDLQNKLNRQFDSYFWHKYTISIDEKVALFPEVLIAWKILKADTEGSDHATD